MLYKAIRAILILERTLSRLLSAALIVRLEILPARAHLIVPEIIPNCKLVGGPHNRTGLPPNRANSRAARDFRQRERPFRRELNGIPGDPEDRWNPATLVS